MGLQSEPKKENNLNNSKETQRDFSALKETQCNVTTLKESIRDFAALKETQRDFPALKETHRDFSALKEPIYNLHKSNESNNKSIRDLSIFKDKLVEEPIKKILTSNDFPTLIDIPIKDNNLTWIKDKSLDTSNLTEVANTINQQSKKLLDEHNKKQQLEEKLLLDEIEHEKCLSEFIKKVKKQYEKDYVTHDENDYINDELQYFYDENSEDNLLYEEMLNEVKNRHIDLNIEFYDREDYYTIYDSESPLFELDEEIQNPDLYFDKTDYDFFENDIYWYKIPDNYLIF
jgi:hypothetical protein